MGRKGSTETISAVLLILLLERSIRQSELQRRAGVGPKALKRVLTDLLEAGVPLVRDVEHPHVYWNVPPNWFPGAVAFQGDDVTDLVRLLHRAPRSKTRDRLLDAIAQSVMRVRLSTTGDGVVTRALQPEDEEHLSVLQESLERKRAVRVHYYTLHRGDVAWRRFSVQRLFVETGRLLAVCHRSDELKWFLLDGVMSVRSDSTEPYREASQEDVERKVRESHDGFHSGRPPVRCVFRVRLPEARWFRRQLHGPYEEQQGDHEFVFTVVTSGLATLARTVLGLGSAACIETPELRDLVRELAQGALAQSSGNSET